VKQIKLPKGLIQMT